MKTLSTLLLALLATVLCACEGSDTYRGSWNAIDPSGAKFKITFGAKNITIKDSTGKSENYTYKQNSVALKNKTKTYGIELSNGTQYTIYFEDLDTDSTGIIGNSNGQGVYMISKKTLSSAQARSNPQ